MRPAQADPWQLVDLISPNDPLGARTARFLHSRPADVLNLDHFDCVLFDTSPSLALVEDHQNQPSAKSHAISDAFRSISDLVGLLKTGEKERLGFKEGT